MGSDYVVLLRGISHVSMRPLREALTNLGLEEVRSFGATGNFAFNAEDRSVATLESRIAEAVGVDAFVRMRSEFITIVREDPNAERPGAAVFFTHEEIGEAQCAALFEGGFQAEPPVISGSQVYFVHPLRRPERKGIIDLERALGVRGTMRASSVVRRIGESL